MTTWIFDQMRASNRRLLALMFFVPLCLGIFEGVYGRVRYAADGINYLNIVRAIHAGDWKLALNPYWGLGYPLVLSAITPLFPATAAGEWIAIHVVNVMIFIATFASFYWLVWTAARTDKLRWIVADEKAERFLLMGSLAIFLSVELRMDNVSRVGPDTLVSCLVFAAAALLMQLRESPGTGRAILLGIVLGAGYVVKTIFLPLGMLFVSIAAILLWKKRLAFTSLLLIVIPAFTLAVPYIAGLSWANGHLTYGESGSLNYAWNVNKLEPGGLWQGQPPRFGTPVHPAQMVSVIPHVYLFNGPFPVTFGPFFNPPYYYQGYYHLFSLKAQIHEAGGNLLRLAKVVSVDFVLYALILGLLLGRRANRGHRRLAAGALSLWPVIFICCAGISMYLLVYIEARYIASFLAILMLTLLFAIGAQLAAAIRAGSGLRDLNIVYGLLVIGCIASLLIKDKDPDRDLLGHVIHHQFFTNNEQWKAGEYLTSIGLRPGDKVAMMDDLVDATESTWAYMDHLQVIGILGGSLLETQHIDYDAYWSATPRERARMLAPFQSAGARLVFAKSKPDGVPAEGWQQVPGTQYWIYRF